MIAMIRKPFAFSAEDAVYFNTFTGVSKKKGVVAEDGKDDNRGAR